jgi:predicted DNA-binding transcriptional regulator AlpA
MTNDDAPLTAVAAARFVGLSEKTFVKIIRSGSGPAATQLGQCLRWRPSSLRRWLDERTAKSGAGGLDSPTCGWGVGLALSDHTNPNS